MIENEVKVALIENIGLPIHKNKSGNLIITYPITKLNSTNSEWDKLVLFYSTDRIFRDKIYIIHYDRMFEHFEFEDPFEVYQVELAVNHMFEMHHEITNTYGSNQEKNDRLISNGLEIVLLLGDIREEAQRVKDQIANLK
jgi:hypothetical protein